MNEALARFKGKTHQEAEAELRDSTVLSIMSEDQDLVWVVREYHHDGHEPGMAGLIALLCLRELGLAQTIHKAVALYWKAIEDHERETQRRLNEVRDDLMSLEEWVAWSSRCRIGPGQEKSWPVKPKWRKPEKLCGLANIMLLLALTELGEGEACNTDRLAAQGIVWFLEARKKYCKKMRRAA